VKAIFAVVSGVLLIQTRIFIVIFFALYAAEEGVNLKVVYATNAKITIEKINRKSFTNF